MNACTLDTVGKTDWTRDGQGRALYPEGFEDLAKKLERPLHPPGRDVRCIVSVAMLTEGWDANTVSHIVGLRPFMGQLLASKSWGEGCGAAAMTLGRTTGSARRCPGAGRALRGVIPFKTTGGRNGGTAERQRISAVPAKAECEITFPRVERYTQRITGRVVVQWDEVPPLEIDPAKIPLEVAMAANLPNNQGSRAVLAPGRVSSDAGAVPPGSPGSGARVRDGPGPHP